MVIAGVLMLIALPNVRRSSDAPEGATSAVGAGRVWRAVQMERFENNGLMPLANDVRPGKLRDAAGASRVRPWPEAGRGGKLLPISASSGTLPFPSGTPNSLAYAVSTNRRSGWLAAYGPRGALVFQRGIGAPAPVVPVG